MSNDLALLKGAAILGFGFRSGGDNYKVSSEARLHTNGEVHESPILVD